MIAGVRSRDRVVTNDPFPRVLDGQRECLPGTSRDPGDVPHDVTLRVIQMNGTISSCGFASGDRFVVGVWRESPIGPTADVMWALPDGTRVLLAPDVETAEFVTSVYGFDEVRITDLSVTASERHLRLTCDQLELRFAANGLSFALPPTPRWFTKYVERPVAYALMGVRTWGVSPTGVQEWYQARRCSFITSARAAVDGVDLGEQRKLEPACGFGFSESPPWPSIVEVRPSLGVTDSWIAERHPRMVDTIW